LAAEFTATQADAYNLIHEGILALADVEQAGIRVDTEYCRTKRDHLSRKIKRLERKLEDSEFVQSWRKRYGKKFNPYSNDQLGKMLYDVWGIDPPKKTPAGGGATDEEALNQIDLPELQHLLKLRKYNKLRDTYLDNFLSEQVDGFIHPFFHLHTVRTFRGSSSDPNFQNIPKRDKEAMEIARRALLPRQGHQLLEVDFSGIEVGIAACYHHDPTMIEYIEDEANDMHGDLAHQIFMLDWWDGLIAEKGLKGVGAFKFLRDATKNSFTFPQFYGDYWGGNAVSFSRWLGLPQNQKWKKGQGIEMPDGTYLVDHLIARGVKSFEDFQEHLKAIEEDFWGRRFAVYGQWREDWFRAYQERGYFDLLTGFRCRGLMTRNDVVNYPVQGAAFHCLLWTLIQINKVAKEEGWKSRIVNQIHDAVILDVHPDELEHVARTVRRIAEVELPKHWPWIIVPLEVEADLCPVDHSWADQHPYDLPEVA
jgi:DNA polymerase-1